jgi:hypothetical protein
MGLWYHPGTIKRAAQVKLEEKRFLIIGVAVPIFTTTIYTNILGTQNYVHHILEIE